MAKATKKALTADEKLAALEAKMGSLEAENTRLSALAMQFMSTPQPQPVVTPNTTSNDDDKVELDLNGLPDPSDPEYSKALGKRMKKAMKAERERIMASIPQPQRVDPAAAARDQFYGGLWDQFKDDHPELASFEGELRTVTAQEVSKLAARGIDVDRYIMANPEKFSEAVAAAAEKHMENLGVDLEQRRAALEKGDGERKQVVGQPAEFIGGPDEEDNSASLEIFGARPQMDQSGQQKGAPKGSNLITELRDMQKRAGIYGSKVAQ